MTSSDAVSQMFDSESQKLQNLIDSVNSKTDMNIHEIVETYYQVMNISSMCVMLKQQADSEPAPLLSKIQETEKMISEKFDSIIHPKILEHLSTTIQELTKNLQSGNFVEQYEKGISHDQ
jgi:hypothetical protein